MILRRIVVVIGLVVLLVGLTEIVLPAQMIAFVESLMRPVVLRGLGAFEFILGVVLIAAAVKRVVRFRVFVLILGI